MIKLYDDNDVLLAEIEHPIDPMIREEVNGEFVATFSLSGSDDELGEDALTPIWELVETGCIVEADGYWFDIVRIERERESDGSIVLNIDAEHVSYRLTDTKVSAPYATRLTIGMQRGGQPAMSVRDAAEALLALSDFGLSIGSVADTDTRREWWFGNVTVRGALIEIAESVGLELDYGTTGNAKVINLVARRGSANAAQHYIEVGVNIESLRDIEDIRESDDDVFAGEYTIAEVAEARNPPTSVGDYEIELGDQVTLTDPKLGISAERRVLRYERDFERPMESKLYIGSKPQDLEQREEDDAEEEPIYTVRECPPVGGATGQEEPATIYTDSDLADFDGTVIRVDGRCAEVSVATGADLVEAESRGLVGITARQSYENCAECHGCWDLTHCGVGDNILTTTDMSRHNGRVVRLPSGECYAVSPASSCDDNDGAIDNTVEGTDDAGVVESYTSCERCTHCYQVTNCWDAEDVLYIRNDLASVFRRDPAFIVQAGYVVEIGTKCYEVTAYGDTCPDAAMVEIGAVHADCNACGCFTLTECDVEPPEVPEVIIANAAVWETTGDAISLARQVGRVVHLDNGVCYTVARSTDPVTDCGTAVSVTVREIHDDCADCRCWRLTNCENEQDFFDTWRDISWAEGLTLYDPVAQKCYRVEQAPDCESTVAWTLISREVADLYEHCDACLGNDHYLLEASSTQGDHCRDTEPGGSNPNIVTNHDLERDVGKWVRVNGVCYQVSRTGAAVTTDPPGDRDVMPKPRGVFDTSKECYDDDMFSDRVNVVTRVWLDDTKPAVMAAVSEFVIEDGKILAVCKLDDIELDGTDCPE